MVCTDLVSVITPMYNAGRTIGRTIESVQAQTHTNWEMLIVDDCSTDGCTEYVRQCMEKDFRIRLISHDKNCGIAGARNTAIGNANGRYLAFLDSDDLWLPQKLQRQIDFMRGHNAFFSYTACEVMDASGNLTGKKRHAPQRICYRDLLKGNVINCLTVMIDRDVASDIVMPSIPHEDYVCWLKLLENGGEAFGLDEVLARYREAENSVSSNKAKAAMWQWNIYRNYLKLDLTKSAWYFVNYTVNAFRKRI